MSSSPRPRVRLQLRHTATAPDELICRANALLSIGQCRKAIEIYTDVIYDHAPGHIVALLNRCLAYIAEVRPELAAADAYRAAQAIEFARNSTGDERHSKTSEIKRYLSTEANCILHKHDWTIEDRRFTRYGENGWFKRPLASIVMDMDDMECPVWHDPGIRLEDICSRLEVRAVYRLCGCLFLCRGGPFQDALGIISDFLWQRRSMFAPESLCFHLLGEEILGTVTQVVEYFRMHGQDTDDEHTISMPTRDTRIIKNRIESLMKTRVAMIPALRYWDDPFEPNFAQSDTHRELRELAATSSSSCIPTAIDQSSIGLLPRINMRASSKDHLPGDLLFHERCPWHVTTSQPDDVLSNWKTDPAGHIRMYCDTCATALLMPSELVLNVITQAASRRSSTATGTRGDDNEENVDTQKRQRRLDWSASTHLSFCSADHEALYCCRTCRRDRRPFDPGLHESKLESELRNGKIPTTIEPQQGVHPGHPRSLYNHSKTQTLYDLLLLRIYATALNQGDHPLELVKFLRGNFSPPDIHSGRLPDSKKPMEVAWSFQNNIVRPFWIFNRYHEELGQDPLQYLRQSDGWVVNTLLAKIQHSTEIIRGATSGIIFNMDKENKTYCYRGLEKWVSDVPGAIYESEAAMDEVWVARLDPLVSMIRIADEANGEKPNCWLKYEEGVKVIAGQPDDPRDKQDVAVKQGEALLRAKPQFLGGSPYDITPWTQSEADPSATAKRNSSPIVNSPSKDHEMVDTKSEDPRSPQSTEANAPNSEDEGSGRGSSSDEEMLEILDEDSPEAPDDGGPVPSPASPPEGDELDSALNGRYEEIQQRLEHLEAKLNSSRKLGKRKNPNTAGKENDSDGGGRKAQDKKLRFVEGGILSAKHWSGHSRVRKPITIRPPRNSLWETLRSADVRRTPGTKEQCEPVVDHSSCDDDAFSDVPVGKILYSETLLDKDGQADKSDATTKAPVKLEMRSISEVRRRKPDQDPRKSGHGPRKPNQDPLKHDHDPWEGSSGSVKGKAIMRGGNRNTLYYNHDEDSDEEEYSYSGDDEDDDWMDVE
ncbi:MAG: hypothetical protein Q9219_005148 [cf. Caloplaca sp. 3 TL-2023]